MVATSIVAVSNPAAVALLGFGVVAGAVLGLALATAGVTSRLEPFWRRADSAGSRSGGGSGLDHRCQALVRALDAFPLGVVLTDASGTWVLHNDFAGAFTGARHSDALVEAAIGDLVDRLLAGDTAGPDHQPHQQALDLYGPPRRRLRLLGFPLTGQDGPGGSVVIIDDQTEAQRLNQVRTDFVANVSHELRTPVGAISVLAETLVGADDPAVTERLAGRLSDEAQRLSDLVNDLLVLSRLESNEPAPHRVIDLVALIRGSVSRRQEAASAQDLDLTGPPADQPPLPVVGDESQLRSVVGNLLDNAIVYTNPGGEVTVSAHQDGPQVRVVVADTGVGIPRADLERVFERFYRVDGARSRHTGGTGLGLSIVRNALRSHGGTVAVASTEGVGTTFTVTLPLAEQVDPLDASVAVIHD